MKWRKCSELTQEKPPKKSNNSLGTSDQIKLGSLIFQRPILTKGRDEVGIVIKIKNSDTNNKPLENKEIKIFWFDHRTSFTYSLVDIEWLLFGQEDAAWKVFN